MLTIKLYNNWEEESKRKCEKSRIMPAKQVKEIKKLIAKGRAIEITDDYIVYEID